MNRVMVGVLSVHVFRVGVSSGVRMVQGIAGLLAVGLTQFLEFGLFRFIRIIQDKTNALRTRAARISREYSRALR